MSLQKRLGLALTVAGFAFIAAMTLIPAPEQVALVKQTSMWCLVCGDLGLVDVLLNVLLYVPYGLGLGLAGVRRRRAVLVIMITTGCIEFLQMKVIAGRDASLSDLMTNTIGGLMGLGLANCWRLAVWPRRGWNRRLAGLAASLWVGIQLFSSWAVHPDLPATTYYGQHAPKLGQFDQFNGQVLDASVAGMPLASEQLPDSRRTRQALQAGGELEVRAVTGTAPAGLAPIFSIFDDQEREVVLLGQRQGELVYHVRTHLAGLRLRGPSLAAEGAIPTGTGDTLSLSGRLTRATMSLRWSVNGGAVRDRTIRLSPSWGWSFVLPYDYAFGRWAPFLTMLWVAGLLVPAGYWGGRDLAPASGLAAGALLLASGLALAPLLTGIPIAALSEWAAGAVGLLAGYALGRWSGRS